MTPAGQQANLGTEEENVTSQNFYLKLNVLNIPFFKFWLLVYTLKASQKTQLKAFGESYFGEAFIAWLVGPYKELFPSRYFMVSPPLVWVINRIMIM